MKKILGVSGVLAIIWLLSKSSKAAAFDRMKFLINGVSLNASNLFAPALDIDLVAQNPTNQSIRVSSMVGTVSLNGSNIGNLSNFTQFVIAANSQTNFTVTCRLALGGLFNQVSQIILGNGGVTATVKINGTVNADGLNIPVELTQKIV